MEFWADVHVFVVFTESKILLHHMDKNLEYVEDYKYIGVTIDSKLLFKKHLNNIIKTVSFKATQLSKICNCLTKETAS